MAARIGATVQARLDSRVFRASLRRAVLASERSKPASGLKDLEAVQRLAGSPVLFAVFDMPWAPFFLFAIYSFHPLLGHLAVAGMLLLVLATVLNQILTKRHESEATVATLMGDNFAETVRQQSEMVQALGMQGAVLDRWQKLRGAALDAQLASGDRVSQFATMTKTFRFFLQSAMLGLGAYVVLHGRDERGRDDRRLDPARAGAGAGGAGDRRLAAGAAGAARAGRTSPSFSPTRRSRRCRPPCPARPRTSR